MTEKLSKYAMKTRMKKANGHELFGRLLEAKERGVDKNDLYTLWPRIVDCTCGAKADVKDITAHTGTRKVILIQCKDCPAHACGDGIDQTTACWNQLQKERKNGKRP